MFGTIGIGTTHCFGQKMQILRRIVSGSGQIVALEDIEHFDHGDATGTRWRHADDLVATVSPAYRLTFDRLILFQILFGDQSTVGTHKIGQQFRVLTLVETVAPLLLNELQSLCQIGLHPQVAQLVGGPVRLQEYLGRGRILLPRRLVLTKTTVECIGDGNAITGKRDSRCYQICPRQAAQLLVRLVETGDRTGNANGEHADMIGVVDDLAIEAQIHRFGGGQRGLLAEIEGGRMAIFAVIDHEATTADIARRRPGHCQRKSRCDGRIHSVTTLFEYFHTDLGGSEGGTGHHAVLDSQWRSATGRVQRG